MRRWPVAPDDRRLNAALSGGPAVAPVAAMRIEDIAAELAAAIDLVADQRGVRR